MSNGAPVQPPTCSLGQQDRAGRPGVRASMDVRLSAHRHDRVGRGVERRGAQAGDAMSTLTPARRALRLRLRWPGLCFIA